MKNTVSTSHAIKVPPAAEHDIRIQFPDGREWLLQYRKYEGNPETSAGASVDLVLDDCHLVYNWEGCSMTAAPAQSKRKQHVRKADQLCVIL